MSRRRRIYLFGGSFNPPGVHHERIVQALQKLCHGNDLIVIIPCGLRPDKEHTNDIDPSHRAAMVELAFASMNRVQIDLSDLEGGEFTRTWDLDDRYRKEFSDTEIWHVVGTDLVVGGAQANSEIHRWYRGEEIFKNRPFVVVTRCDLDVPTEDFPRNHEVLNPGLHGSSTQIRKQRAERLDIALLVNASVRCYMERWHLYTGRATLGAIHWQPEGPGLIVPILADPSNPSPQRDQRVRDLIQMVERINQNRSGQPDHVMVVGGDGWMLDAIAKQMNLRLPFVGLNAGTVGYLLNGGSPEQLEERLLRGTYRLYRQPLLSVEYVDQSGRVRTTHTFNEAFLRARGDHSAWMRVTIDGQERFDRLVGDGLMISTPAGSTGWAHALGATPVMIGTPQVILTGDATTHHRRRWVSAPLPGHATTDVEVLGGQKRPMRLVLSGRCVGEVSGAKIRLSRAHAAELAFFPETDLAEKLMQLHLGTDQ